MNSSQAREVLLRYRPGMGDPDEEVTQALALAGRDPVLGEWWHEQQQFHQALESRFQEISVPPGLRERILAAKPLTAQPTTTARPILRLPFWLPIAAALVLLLVLMQSGRPPERSGPPNQLREFQSRMVRTVLREYQMELVTNDLPALRQFQSERGAIGDYQVAPGLQNLKLTGGGVLRWQNQPVSMICFDRGNQEMVFLFVVDRSFVSDPPGPEKRMDKVNRLKTATWSEGGKVYLLAADPEFPM